MTRDELIERLADHATDFALIASPFVGSAAGMGYHKLKGRYLSRRLKGSRGEKRKSLQTKIKQHDSDKMIKRHSRVGAYAGLAGGLYMANPLKHITGGNSLQDRAVHSVMQDRGIAPKQIKGSKKDLDNAFKVANTPPTTRADVMNQTSKVVRDKVKKIKQFNPLGLGNDLGKNEELIEAIIQEGKFTRKLVRGYNRFEFKHPGVANMALGGTLAALGAGNMALGVHNVRRSYSGSDTPKFDAAIGYGGFGLGAGQVQGGAMLALQGYQRHKAAKQARKEQAQWESTMTREELIEAILEGILKQKELPGGMWNAWDARKAKTRDKWMMAEPHNRAKWAHPGNRPGAIHPWQRIAAHPSLMPKKK